MSEIVETYRGCEIYFVQAAEDMGRPAYYTPCLSGEWYWTAQATRNAIDELLDPIEPPPDEEPPDGLLAQIVAAIKTWVNENLDAYLRPIWDWINEGLASAKAAWENLVAGYAAYWEEQFAKRGERIAELDRRWDALQDQTIPDLWEEFKKMSKELGDDLDQAMIDLQASEAELRVLGDEAVKVDVRSWFPADFLKDPLGYIGAAFANLINSWVEGITRSFWEGFEEGLEE